MSDLDDPRVQRLLEAFGKQEDLHPDLQEYLEEGGRFGPMLRHPLVYSIMHAPEMNAMMNQQYEAKRKAIAEASTERAWGTYIFMHERPYRVNAFISLDDRLTDSEYWSLLGRIWVDSENIRQQQKVWHRLLSSDRKDRAQIMYGDERAALAALPAWIPVFQGHTNESHDGWSWTTNKSTAEWFAQRFADFEDATPVVTSGTVRRCDVLAFFTRRGENEILVKRGLVKNKGRRIL